MARSLRGSSLLGGGLASIVPLLRNTRFEVFPASGIEDAVAQWVPADQTVTVTASPRRALRPSATLVWYGGLTCADPPPITTVSTACRPMSATV